MLNDANVVFSHVAFPSDDATRLETLCSLEAFLLENVIMGNKIIIIADTRHTHCWSQRDVGPLVVWR